MGRASAWPRRQRSRASVAAAPRLLPASRADRRERARGRQAVSAGRDRRPGLRRVANGDRPSSALPRGHRHRYQPRATSGRGGSGQADLAGSAKPRLGVALADGTLRLTGDPAAIASADAVIMCVPTPVDSRHVPELSALRGACADVVAHARAGQTIILSSTTYVGTTTELLAEPLARRGLEPGKDMFVAFSPERIDPGNPDHQQDETPRVVGGVTSGVRDPGSTGSSA